MCMCRKAADDMNDDMRASTFALVLVFCLYIPLDERSVPGYV